jgi:glycosyltransferase involved in cell wall biosynthesis
MLSPDAQMIDRRILQEASSLQRAGHHVTVLSGFECSMPDAYEQPDGVVVKRYVFDWTDLRKLRVLRRYGRLGPLVWPFVRIVAKVFGLPSAFETFVASKALEHQFDVVHVHDFPLLRAAARIAQSRQVPLVYDSHEFYPVQSCFTKKQQRKFLAIERANIRRCQHVITVNPYIAQMMARVHGVREPTVILNASPLSGQVRHDEPSSARGAARQQYGLPPDAFIFVYQGWISAERNLESMIQAMTKTSAPAVLVIIGYGEHVHKLRDLAQTLGVSDRVVFYGRVESEQLPDITNLCDVGIIPYAAVDEMHRYCSPNKLFEFISAQIPIISSDLPYLRDVVGEYNIGWLCNTSSPDALAHAMNTALATNAGESMQDNLRKASAIFNWSIEEQKLLGIYSQLEPNTGSEGLARNAARERPLMH